MKEIRWNPAVVEQLKKVKLQQLLFGKAIPVAVKPKSRWRLTTPKSRRIFRDGKTLYLYDGLFGGFKEDGSRFRDSSVETKHGLLRVSDEMVEKVRKIFNQIGVKYDVK